jgi:putative transposase
MASVPDRHQQRLSGFRRIAEAFLSQPGLPFTRLLSAERIEQAFAKHGHAFGGSVYSTAIMVWSFLGQVLRDGKEASCQAAVARVVAYQREVGGAVPTADTGDYCRARSKLSRDALRALAIEIGAEVEREADAAWLWKGRHAKLVDGFTFTLPDTAANQAVYPQHGAQKRGVGFPIARACVILSLATACILDLAVGPYSGKETGETALLRRLLQSFSPGDVLVADRYYCSFLMIALLAQQGIDVCARLHQRRTADFRRGRRLGPDDHLITWTKPPRPDWMDEETYAKIPATLTLREMRYCVARPGCRVRVLTVVTTLLDAEVDSRQDIAQLYGFRWNSELDIRSIKQSLNLAHVRCKSSEMVHRELWTTLLGYNLIRTTAAAAAALHEKQPRQIGFTAACQCVLAAWSLLSRERSVAQVLSDCRALLAHIAQCEVANRPGRIEPRQLKRRRHGYKLMQEPRDVLRSRLKHN